MNGRLGRAARIAICVPIRLIGCGVDWARELRDLRDVRVRGAGGRGCERSGGRGRRRGHGERAGRGEGRRRGHEVVRAGEFVLREALSAELEGNVGTLPGAMDGSRRGAGRRHRVLALRVGQRTRGQGEGDKRRTTERTRTSTRNEQSETSRGVHVLFSTGRGRVCLPVFARHAFRVQRVARVIDRHRHRGWHIPIYLSMRLSAARSLRPLVYRPRAPFPALAHRSFSTYRPLTMPRTAETASFKVCRLFFLSKIGRAHV